MFNDILSIVTIVVTVVGLVVVIVFTILTERLRRKTNRDLDEMSAMLKRENDELCKKGEW